MDTDFEPLNWGWENGVFLPIMTDKEPGLMKMIRCICAKGNVILKAAHIFERKKNFRPNFFQISAVAA